MSIKALKGFKDILPDEVVVWQWIELTARDIFHRFGFTEIKVPILEKTELFARSIGVATDIVEKEMYTFTDRNGSSITMRPEGTASVLRAFIEHTMHVRLPVQRLYSIGPMFRHERPQKGRLRQFHQLSIEALGSDHPRLDAEIMAMSWLLLKELGLEVSLQINSLGCPACRPAYKDGLVSFLADCHDNICNNCQRRSAINPLRVLDCKSAHCQQQYKDAPSILTHLCSECAVHFTETRAGLVLLDIPYEVNSCMVRGLDYYTRTTFELVTGELGAQNAVGAGGRYDGLVAQLGGPQVPGIGFAMGIERLVLLLAEIDAKIPAGGIDLFLASIGQEAAQKSFVLAHALRSKGVRVIIDHEQRSLKSQMKQANRYHASYTLIMGEDELTKGEAILRNMATREQLPVLITEDNAVWSDTVVDIIIT